MRRGSDRAELGRFSSCATLKHARINDRRFSIFNAWIILSMARLEITDYADFIVFRFVSVCIGFVFLKGAVDLD